MDEWLHARGLLGLLSFEGVDEVNENVLRYKFKQAGPGPGSSGPGPGEKPSRVYHGTWWYALRTACVLGGCVLCISKKRLKLGPGSCVVGDT